MGYIRINLLLLLLLNNGVFPAVTNQCRLFVVVNWELSLA